MKKIKKTKVISLFSGCGGMDLGFELAGFEIVWAADKDPIACETYAYNLGKKIHCLDIRKVDPSIIPGADVLISGPPCQGFSTVGKRDPSDDRNLLYLDVIRIVAAKRPRVVVIENVKGLKSFKKGEVLGKLVNGLEEIGFKVEWGILNAKDFRIPQNRERLFIVAHDKESDGFFDRVREHKADSVVSLKEALGDLEKILTLPNHWHNGNINTDHKLILSKIKQGQKLCDTRMGGRSVHTWEIPAVFGKVSALERKILETIARHRRLREYEKEQSWNDANPLTITEIKTILGKDISAAIKNLIRKGYIVTKGPGLYDLKHTFNGKFRRLDNKRPSEAVLTNFGSVRNFVHPTKTRPFTVRECARIQSFPDNYIIKGSLHSQYRQIGNAVPPLLAKIIAEEVKFETDRKLKRKSVASVDFIPYAVNEIIHELKKYKKLKPNTSSRSFGTRLLPINGNIERVCQRLDLLPLSINNKQQCSILNSLIPLKERLSFYRNCVEHSKLVCLPIDAKCEVCEIERFCNKG